MIRPIIILGPPRCGTNLLRDLLTGSAYNLVTWKCDEINPIWRIPSPNSTHDALSPDLLNSMNISLIHSCFAKLLRHKSNYLIVEKTCANCLRPDYIRAVFPEAFIVSITRNGQDAIPSAVKKAQSARDIFYTLKKLQYVPIQSLKFYIRSHFFSLFSSTHFNSSLWGPIYPSMRSDLQTFGLEYALASQWVHCISGIHHLHSLHPPSHAFSLTYEDLVLDPTTVISQLFSKLNLSFDSAKLSKLSQSVYTSSIGLGSLSSSQQRPLKETSLRLIHDTQKMLGYSS